MSTVQEMRDEGLKPSPARVLAVRFRKGESLTRDQLHSLRRYAQDNGNGLLLAALDEELQA